ncbi:MAG TPA: ParB N-terminal domain-containing protein [Vineibacter sp.]|nr:ParB N-terminal domain-containing protein [Vineibacter sp.]
MTLLGLHALRPHESHDEAAAQRLAARIAACGFWTTPIAVEPTLHVILDGHHRWRAAHLLALSYVPAVVVSYDDPGITLGSWRADEAVSPNRVLDCAASGALLPIRTSRHSFAPEIGLINLPIAVLARQGPISRTVAAASA